MIPLTPEGVFTMDQETNDGHETEEGEYSTGEIIRLLRQSVNLTEDQFAKSVNIDTIRLSLIEDGTAEPDHKILNAIAKFLDLPLEILEIHVNHTNQELITDLRELILTVCKLFNKP